MRRNLLAGTNNVTEWVQKTMSSFLPEFSPAKKWTDKTFLFQRNVLLIDEERNGAD